MPFTTDAQVSANRGRHQSGLLLTTPPSPLHSLAQKKPSWMENWSPSSGLTGRASLRTNAGLLAVRHTLMKIMRAVPPSPYGCKLVPVWRKVQPLPFPPHSLFPTCQPIRDDGSRNVSETGPKKKKEKTKEKQTQNRFWSGKREPIFRTFRYTGPPRQRWPLLVSFAACCCFGLESISVKGDTEVKVRLVVAYRYGGVVMTAT